MSTALELIIEAKRLALKLREIQKQLYSMEDVVEIEDFAPSDFDLATLRILEDRVTENKKENKT
jgi:hypothetical protein